MGPVVTAHLEGLVSKERHDNGRHTVLEPDCCRPRSAVMADRRNAAVGKQPIVRYVPYNGKLSLAHRYSRRKPSAYLE
jgi:hypothetical protein